MAEIASYKERALAAETDLSSRDSRLQADYVKCKQVSAARVASTSCTLIQASLCVRVHVDCRIRTSISEWRQR